MFICQKIRDLKTKKIKILQLKKLYFRNQEIISFKYFKLKSSLKMTEKLLQNYKGVQPSAPVGLIF